MQRLLDELTTIVRPIVGKPKLDVLAYVARTVVVADRAYAERFATAIPNDRDRAKALADMAAALAEVDPNSAEHLITGIETPAVCHAKLAIAKAVGRTNPDRVRRLLKEAERGHDLAAVAAAHAALGNPERARRLLIRLERASRGPRWDPNADPDDVKHQEPGGLSLAAVGLATLDPRRAEKIARSIRHPYVQVSTLLHVAAAIASGDPSTADRIARSVPFRVHDSPRPPTEVVLAMAPVDPARAEALARTVPDEFYLGPLLAELAGVLGGAAHLITDAERIAEQTLHEHTHATIMIAVATAVAATDPDRAEGIVAALAEGHAEQGALVDIAAAMTAAHPGRADRILRSVTDPHRRVEAQLRFVAATASIDIDRAEQVARSIDVDFHRACAFAEVIRGLARPR